MKKILVNGMLVLAAFAAGAQNPDSVKAAGVAPPAIGVVDSAAKTGDTANAMPPAGSLRITTDPQGVSVLWDDSTVGESPVTVLSVDTGNHTVELRKKGYYRKKVELHIDATSPRQYRFTLLQPGRIFVTTIPPGAAVLLDNKEKGTSPFLFETLHPGDHSVRVLLQSYVSEARTATVKSDTTDTLAMVLTHVVVAPAPPVPSPVAPAPPRSRTLGKLGSIIVISAFGAFAIALAIIEGVSK